MYHVRCAPPSHASKGVRHPVRRSMPTPCCSPGSGDIVQRDKREEERCNIVSYSHVGRGVEATVGSCELVGSCPVQMKHVNELMPLAVA